MTEHEATAATFGPVSPWHTSTYSAERGECVEVSEGPITGVRDTKNREVGALFFTAGEWQAFLGTARSDLR
ncbi:DUF397 domain-containing protein [Nocardiopsis xinjiangensis]|uniref:DUF397 domain-containing protein n=1 Tax=Nocardiopsis xinjiangensis TaxID=124285 RepID=UPI00037C7668|nr:DUF397 domain-containing protein [Nocardiopsis xinjiangensis]